MNRTTVQSIKEVGQVRVSKLSYKKIQLDYNVPICADGIVVTDAIINIKARYNITKGLLGDRLELIFPKEKFYNSLSMRFAVKKKFIGTSCTHSNSLKVSVDDKEYSIDRLIKSFDINDKVWARDFKINELFK